MQVKLAHTECSLLLGLGPSDFGPLAMFNIQAVQARCCAINIDINIYYIPLGMC